LKNAFSVELPINSSDISSIKGGLGLQADATKAIVNVFANSKEIISNYNTKAGTIPQVTDTITISMDFEKPQDFSLSSFNPFIFIDESGKGRGFEVHLPDMAPSELVDISTLGTNADDSNPKIGRYYKTANNLPFAINIPETFNYPIEREAIINGHLKFAAWAQSGGTQFQDWYKNLSDYRKSSNLY
jgi:LruC domain-containing protein